MANRKSRTNRDGQGPQAEGPLPTDETTPPPLDEGRESIPPEGFVPPEDSTPPPPLDKAPLRPEDEPGIASGERIAPEDMAPLDAERVGPEPDPAAADGLEPDATLAAGTGTDPAATEALHEPHEPETGKRPEEPATAYGAAPGAFAAAEEPERRPDPARTPEPAAPPASDPRHDPVRDEHGDEGGRSIAGTLLIALLLLLAGAAIGIWAAPQIAPRLPAGMAPISAWLSPPDSELETRLGTVEAEAAAQAEALRAEIVSLREELAAEEAPADAAAEIEARVADLEGRVGSRIEELAAEVAALEGGATRERVAQIEATVGGLEETIASFNDQLAQAEAAGDATAEIDAYQAEVAGLRGEVQDVARQVAQLSSRIDEVAAQASRQVELAREQVSEIETQAAEAEAQAAEELTSAQTQAALAQIRSALEAGTPYNEALMQLASLPDLSVPAALTNPAPEGVPTVQGLRDTFSEAANEAIRASIQARGAEGGILDRLTSFAESQVASRSLEPRAGSDADAVLSRMEAALRSGDVEAALAEAEALPPPAAETMEPWLAAANARLDAMESFEALQAELSATN